MKKIIGNGTKARQMNPIKLINQAMLRLWKKNFAIIGNFAATKLLTKVLITMALLALIEYTSTMYTTPLINISTAPLPIKTPERACQPAGVEGSEVH